MKTTGIPESTIDFLVELGQNNNREWFNENKDRYLAEEEKMREFAEALHSAMSKHDHLEPMSGKEILFRIYRDTRFSKDKSPYKAHRSGSFKRATARLRGGYYFHIEPGDNSFLAGGFWRPEKEDLDRIRQEIDFDDKPLRKIINQKKFRETFGGFHGEQLKGAPRGYAKDHPAIDLLRNKSFVVIRQFKDKQVTDNSFLTEANNTFKALRPFFDYMSEVLTTDANGRSIID